MPVAATISLTYNGFVSSIANLAVMQTQTVSGVVQGVDASFNIMLPQSLNYSELRIQRDLDLLPSQTSQSYSLVTGNNQLQLGVDDFVTVQTISITSGGGTFPLLPVTKEFLQNVCGTPASTAMPAYFAMVGGDQATGGNTYNNILVGPYPDANYPVIVFGTQRLSSLYQYASAGAADASTTFISSLLPDMLIQAAMIFVSGFQRNFSANSSDPEMPGSYENQYQNLLKGALTENFRAKGQASGWTSYSNPVIATPGR